MLRLENITKTYYTPTEETNAISNLDISVDKGEFVAVVGPSGCGKTTLLSIICGTLKPTSGTVFLNNQPVEGTSTRIGYMLQHDHLFDWRTINKNITLGLEISHNLTPENLSYVNELAHKYGLTSFLNHYPTQLSGGMRQRAALIRTLALNPEIMLLDEPFSALDYQTRLNVCDDVYSIIKKEEKTVLLVTHDISEAISMADRIIILTKRPSTVKRIVETNLSHINTPLQRREDRNFSKLFEIIWKELNTND